MNFPKTWPGWQTIQTVDLAVPSSYLLVPVGPKMHMGHMGLNLHSSHSCGLISYVHVKSCINMCIYMYIYIHISLVKQPIFGLLYFVNILRPYPMCCSRIIISSHGCVSHPICVVQPAVISNPDILYEQTGRSENKNTSINPIFIYIYIYIYILRTHRYGTTTHILQVN